MEKHNNFEFRNRLDKALSSAKLANDDFIKTLVKDQLLRSSSCGSTGDIVEDVVQRRTAEVSNFLEMLRSASGFNKDALNHKIPHNDWKLKQDNDHLRVMYREGPQGTPYHTLLAEGYVDAPIDVCLCVSWESTLYKKWWPQFTIPPFKIINSTSLQKVRIGEEISLLRVKAPWPISARDALLHYFELEFFEEDIVIVLINTISDTEQINMQTHGFTSDGIPEANDVVRIGFVGGFALQKVNSNKSYFRTIANVDIKFDIVPPALINFISRQLIGSGFKLYQKAVASVDKGDDEDFIKVQQEEPMYTRIRENLIFPTQDTNDIKPLDIEKLSESPAKEPSDSAEEPLYETARANTTPVIGHQTLISEIIEEEEDEEAEGEEEGGGEEEEEEEEVYEPATHVEENQQMGHFSSNTIVENYEAGKERVFISPEVEWALGVLDKAITFFQERGNSNEESVYLKKAETGSTTSPVGGEFCNSDSRNAGEMNGVCRPPESDEAKDSFSFPDFRLFSTDSSSPDVDGVQKVFPLPEQSLPSLEETQECELGSSHDKAVTVGVVAHVASEKVEAKTSCVRESSVNGGTETFKPKPRKQRLCCFRLPPRCCEYW